jgi:hypothetical protein
MTTFSVQDKKRVRRVEREAEVGFHGDTTQPRNPMLYSKELKAALQPHFTWHGARLTFLSLFLIALFKVRSVNLSDLCLGFEGTAKSQSSLKRLSRFFRQFEVKDEEIAQIVVNWMKIPQPWVLSLDRTTGKVGKTWHNMLVLGMVQEGMAYPILWEMLEKKGNSDQAERMDLLNRFTRLFPKAEVSYIAGDREFVGQAWTRYLLLEPLLSFRLRIRATDQVVRDGVSQSVRVLFSALQPGEAQILTGACTVWGCRVTVAALRLPDGNLLAVIAPANTPEIIQDYGQRWAIETLFGAFKTRGFCLESTHFQDPERLSKLFALLTLALCWAMQTGIFEAAHSPIPLKNHRRKTKSIFRTGLDHLGSIPLSMK